MPTYATLYVTYRREVFEGKRFEACPLSMEYQQQSISATWRCNIGSTTKYLQPPTSHGPFSFSRRAGFGNNHRKACPVVGLSAADTENKLASQRLPNTPQYIYYILSRLKVYDHGSDTNNVRCSLFLMNADGLNQHSLFTDLQEPRYPRKNKTSGADKRLTNQR